MASFTGLLLSATRKSFVSFVYHRPAAAVCPSYSTTSWIRPLVAAAPGLHIRSLCNGETFGYLTAAEMHQREIRSGFDLEHWRVSVDDPEGNLTRDEIIDSYIKTLAMVVGSEEEAKKKIYSVSTRRTYFFGVLGSQELARKLDALPNVAFVFPDQYEDVENKVYGGEPFVNGQAVPYDPKYHEYYEKLMSKLGLQDEWDMPNDIPPRSRNFEGGSKPPTPSFYDLDVEHWFVAVEEPEGDPTSDEIIDSYIKTLAMVVGSEEEARIKLYSVNTRLYYSFGARVSMELACKLTQLPNVLYVQPDVYNDVFNKVYGGEPLVNGQADSYDPKYNEGWVRDSALQYERYRRNGSPRILFDVEHWCVDLKDPEGDPTRDELIDSYIKTLAVVVGSEEEARKKIYSVSTSYYYAFGARVSMELAFELLELPNVREVLPDVYKDVEDKIKRGKPFFNEYAVPYYSACHEYNEELLRKAALRNERDMRNDRPHRSIKFKRGSKPHTPSFYDLDVKHWFVVLKVPEEDLTCDRIAEICIHTLAMVVGSKGEAEIKIYSCSTRYFCAFGAHLSMELACELTEMPNVLYVQPDVYNDVLNRVYGGEPTVNEPAFVWPKFDEQWERDPALNYVMYRGLRSPLEMWDVEHWCVELEDPKGDPTRDELIDNYIKTVAMVVGSEEEARMTIYSVSTRYYYGFGVRVPKKLAFKLLELPNVRGVLPDVYKDVENKVNRGKLFVNGQAVLYDPKYHEKWMMEADYAMYSRNRPCNSDRSRNIERSSEPPMGGQNPGGGPGANFDRSANFGRRSDPPMCGWNPSATWWQLWRPTKHGPNIGKSSMGYRFVKNAKQH